MIVTNWCNVSIHTEPDMRSRTICVLPSEATLLVDPTKSTDEWFFVCTEIGVEGYCTKKYVAPKH